MPTAAQIMDFETQFDNAVKIALNGLGSEVPIITFHSVESAEVPRVEVKVQIGTAKFAAISGDRTTGWLYGCSVTIDAFSRRVANGDARPIIGQIRSLLLPQALTLNNLGLAFVQIVGWEEAASSRRVFNSDGQKSDVNTLVYNYEFAIQPQYQAAIG